MSTDTKPASTAHTHAHTTTKKAVEEAAPVGNQPIIVDLGKKDRKDVRKLKKGKPGKLMSRIEESLEHLVENGAITKDAQPVIIIVQQRAKRKGRRMAKMWGLG